MESGKSQVPAGTAYSPQWMNIPNLPSFHHWMRCSRLIDSDWAKTGLIRKARSPAIRTNLKRKEEAVTAFTAMRIPAPPALVKPTRTSMRRMPGATPHLTAEPLQHPLQSYA